MFKIVKELMQKEFKKLSQRPLFFVEVDRDEIWNRYLQGIPEDKRQENNCNCCKSFMRQFGGIVGISDDYKIQTLWDFTTDLEEYAGGIKAVGDYVRSLPIQNVFRNTFAKCGTDNNVAPGGTRWHHYFVELPRQFVCREIGPLQSEARSSYDVFHRSLNEITKDAVDTVLELIASNSLYRAKDSEGAIKAYQKVQLKYATLSPDQKRNFVWLQSVESGPAIARLRNTAMGTLLVDLSEGKELDHAVSAYERIMAPANYKRPTTLATPAMIKKAQDRLIELGLLDSLNRRHLKYSDLSMNNTLFMSRKSQLSGDVFAQLQKDVTVHPKTLSRVEEITIDKFIENVLPTAKNLRVLLENTHLDNLVTLIGPVDASEKTLFKWKNNFSWAYTGEVADSIKTRVKAAGGKVDGVLRVSLSWANYDDLDLHLIDPKGHETYYMNKGMVNPSGCMLDVDMNAGCGTSLTPVENIFWKNNPKIEGVYKVVVHQYAKRDSEHSEGFEVEIDFNGETYHFSVPSNGSTGRRHGICEFTYTKLGGVVLNGKSGSVGNYPSKEKWGLKTGQFIPVHAVTLSPNHWNNDGHGKGEKHFIFLLDKCQSDEKVRAFFNEQLDSVFEPDRKVFELLGSKLKIDPVEGELSGIGFAETAKNNHLFVEVDGAVKRILKIKF